ncbi:hypothetical protein LX36DRAFT_750201 [Colletotrichum falcatum]|nr:hypothetical protein LX36DRAFT_750201 [Colletotrichum falcatum]
MRTAGPLLALASTLSPASVCAARPYSEWLASSLVARNYAIRRDYDPAVLFDGIARVAVHVGNDTLLGVAEAAVSSLVTDAGALAGGCWATWRRWRTASRGARTRGGAGTAMFSYGLLRGVREGASSRNRYRDVGLRAYGPARERSSSATTGTGRVHQLPGHRPGGGSPNSNASFEYYTSIPVVENDARGGGAFMFAAIEAEQL